MKFLFIGDRKTGKTSVAHLMCNTVNEILLPTIGMQFHTSPSFLHKIWDLSGDATSQSLIKAVINDCHAIVYFCVDETSFQNIKKIWYFPNDKRKYLCVKCQPTVEMKLFAQENKIKFINASSNDIVANLLAKYEWQKYTMTKPWCCFPFLYKKHKKYDRLLVSSQ